MTHIKPPFSGAIRPNIWLKSAFLAVLLASLCSAGTIVSVGPSETYSRALIAPGIGVYSFGWSQLDTYDNVVISLDIFEDPRISELGGSITAYLTDQVGPGTTQAANELTPSVTVPFPVGQIGLLALFSGLTLGPGNYFVTVTGNTGFALIGEAGLPTETLDAGVTLLGYGSDCCTPSSYVPDQVTPWENSSWTFEVTGDRRVQDEEQPIPQVPEPSTYVLLGSGLMLCVFRRFRKNPVA